MLLLFAGAAAVAYRATYTNWPGDGPPRRLRFSGRIYERGDRPGEPARALADTPLRPVFRAPPVVGHQVFSIYTPREGRQRLAAGDTVVTQIFMETARDRYVEYTLLGGP